VFFLLLLVPLRRAVEERAQVAHKLEAEGTLAKAVEEKENYLVVASGERRNILSQNRLRDSLNFCAKVLRVVALFSCALEPLSKDEARKQISESMLLAAQQVARR
jgi:hypothetical protein